MWLLASLVGAAVTICGVALASDAMSPGANVTLGDTPLAAYKIEPPVRLRTAQQSAAQHPAEQHPAAGVPVSLQVPKLGVDVPVVAIQAAEGVLTPPDDPQTLGWWSAGARPGALLGGAIITGHTVSSGGGAFDDLDTLRAGDRVAVQTPAGRIGYAVSAVSIYRKASLAKHAAKVFDQSAPGKLVLVTCEDWDGEKYLSNAVVLASPVP